MSNTINTFSVHTHMEEVESLRAEIGAVEVLAAAAAEARARLKHSAKIVEGSMMRAHHFGGDIARKWNQKFICVIKTRGKDGEFDGNHRLVATSDLHQIHHTVEVAKALKKAGAKDKAGKAKQASIDAMVSKLETLGVSKEEIASLLAQAKAQAEPESEPEDEDEFDLGDPDDPIGV
jgi:hypothetical protein